MKILGTEYNSITVKEIVCDATAGANVYESVAEGIQLAGQTRMPVVVIHNGKRFPITIAEMLKNIKPEENK